MVTKSFDNSGFLRSKGYNAEEFSQIVFGRSAIIRPAPTEWATDNPLHPASTAEGLHYCVDGSTAASYYTLPMGRFRVKKENNKCYFLFLPKFVVSVNDTFATFDSSDISNAIELYAWSTDISGLTLPVFALYAAPDGSYQVLTNPSEQQKNTEGVYTLYDSAYVEIGYPTKVTITGANTKCDEIVNFYKDSFIVKLSNEQPFNPYENTLWLYNP